ncbi:hypothetical protein Efla_007769 [Eimeria flavescens]
MDVRGLRGGFSCDDPDPDPVVKPPNFTISEWMRKLGRTEVYEADLQHLVLNYMTINGLAGPAEEFCREARVQPQMPLHCIIGRAKIEDAVLSGRTEEAIQEISRINVDLLRKDPEVTFMLYKQQLLQLIESGDAGEAIDFAQKHLAPCVKECPQLLAQLEDAMALLAFNDLSCPEAQKLLGGAHHREEAARRIDDAILDLFDISSESALELLTKNALFSQRCLQTSCRSLCPMVVDLRKGTLGTSAVPPGEADAAVNEEADKQGNVQVGNPQHPLQQQDQQTDSAGLRQRQQAAIHTRLFAGRG